MAFMTAPSTSSTNDVNTAKPAYEVSTVSPNVNTDSSQVSTARFSDNVVYAFMVENPNGFTLLQYYHRTCKKFFINANDTAGYDKSKAHCKYHQNERMVYGNNYNRVNYKYTTHRTHLNAQRNMVPRAVLIKTGLKTFNTARTVNTAHPKSTVYSAKPMSFNTAKAQAVNTARPKAVNTTRPKAVKTARPNFAAVNVVRGKPQQDDTRFVDSGCSRHMTGTSLCSIHISRNLIDVMLHLWGRAHGGRILLNPRVLLKLYLFTLGGSNEEERFRNSNSNYVWILVDFPTRKRAIGTKWVFRNKKDERGIVISIKQVGFAQGHRQGRRHKTMKKFLLLDLERPLVKDIDADDVDCKKQTVVATFTTEAEYVAAASCCRQVLWIQNQLLDYRKVFSTWSQVWNALILNVPNSLLQFWQTAGLITTEDGVRGITATIDRKVKVFVSVASIRRHRKLEDFNGISSLPTAEIFEQLALIGYEITSDSLTFQKGHFSPQWKFFIHTILHCLSPKKTAWEQFSSNIATAIIFLATNRTFNFSHLIFEAMEDEEDPSKQGRSLIKELDFDVGISLVPTHAGHQGRIDDTQINDQPEEQLGVFSAATTLTDAARRRQSVENVCSFMLCDLDFEPLSLSLSSLPSCDLVSLANILILCLILKASNQSLRKSLSLNLELS
ncbi:hypothetical protein Tco_0007958 [Tanacetum coccineum]